MRERERRERVTQHYMTYFLGTFIIYMYITFIKHFVALHRKYHSAEDGVIQHLGYVKEGEPRGAREHKKVQDVGSAPCHTAKPT